jgi:hypothetical protein
MTKDACARRVGQNKRQVVGMLNAALRSPLPVPIEIFRISPGTVKEVLQTFPYKALPET